MQFTSLQESCVIYIEIPNSSGDFHELTQNTISSINILIHSQHFCFKGSNYDANKIHKFYSKN